MPIFKINASKLKKLSTLNLDKERNLQKLVEENLMEVLEFAFSPPNTPPPSTVALIPSQSMTAAK